MGCIPQATCSRAQRERGEEKFDFVRLQVQKFTSQLRYYKTIWGVVVYRHNFLSLTWLTVDADHAGEWDRAADPGRNLMLQNKDASSHSTSWSRHRVAWRSSRGERSYARACVTHARCTPGSVAMPLFHGGLPSGLVLVLTRIKSK